MKIFKRISVPFISILVFVLSFSSIAYAYAEMDSYNNMYANMMADIDRISQENYEVIASEFDKMPRTLVTSVVS